MSLEIFGIGFFITLLLARLLGGNEINEEEAIWILLAALAWPFMWGCIFMAVGVLTLMYTFSKVAMLIMMPSNKWTWKLPDSL